MEVVYELTSLINPPLVNPPLINPGIYNASRAQALACIDDAIESAVIIDLLASDDENEDENKDKDDVMCMMRMIFKNLCKFEKSLPPTDMYPLVMPVLAVLAGTPLILLRSIFMNSLIQHFLHFCRMHRGTFWQLVEVLTQAGGDGYWEFGISELHLVDAILGQ